ncbi:MAG: CPBP family intramembrane metalloprotease [Butyrivibrio sp.]|nr:CPBP family intramembrane metalloprotease [Butyrivibrio sp.]
MEKSIKGKKTFWNLPFIPVLEFVIMFGFLIVQALIQNFLYQIVPQDNGFLITFIEYSGTIISWILIVIYAYLVKPDRPTLRSFGTKVKGNNFKNAFIGLIIGVAMNAACVLAALVNKDIALYFDQTNIVKMIVCSLILFAAVFIQSSSEELLCRGFLYQRFRQTCKSPAVAIIAPSVLFGMMHLFNAGVTVLSFANIVLVGLLFALMVHYCDSLWMAFMAHTGWNFSQSILFGLPNSGRISPFSIFKLDLASAKNSFAYNVGFGVEGTVFACALIAVVLIAFLIYGIMSKKHPTPVWED